MAPSIARVSDFLGFKPLELLLTTDEIVYLSETITTLASKYFTKFYSFVLSFEHSEKLALSNASVDTIK